MATVEYDAAKAEEFAGRMLDTLNAGAVTVTEQLAALGLTGLPVLLVTSGERAGDARGAKLSNGSARPCRRRKWCTSKTPDTTCSTTHRKRRLARSASS